MKGSSKHRQGSQARTARLLILVHIGLSLGSFLFHWGQHPPGESLFYWLAAPVSALSLIVLPPLFMKPDTVGLACLINATAVGLGSIAMLFFSLNSLDWPVSLAVLITEPTIPATCILWTKIPLAQAIFTHVRMDHRSERVRGCAE